MKRVQRHVRSRLPRFVIDSNTQAFIREVRNGRKHLARHAAGRSSLAIHTSSDGEL
jgi:hypothetical protein